MGQMTLYCRECDQDQVFDQPHQGTCPDVAGGGCPEWACTGCGAAVITGAGVLLAGAGPACADRVA